MKLTRRLLERMIREEYQQYYIAPERTHLMPGATSDESGITMTDENYEKLMVLLNSDDRENVEMGIELADSLGFSLPPTEIPDNEEYKNFLFPRMMQLPIQILFTNGSMTGFIEHLCWTWTGMW